MATFNKFNCFVEDMAEKVHNLGTDTLKFALTNTAPVATNTVIANITEVANGGGYTTGGSTSAQTGSAQSSGTYKLTLTDVVFTATTGFGPFRYAVLYNSTPVAGNLIGYYDYGSSVTLAASETFTVDVDAANGTLTVA